MFNKSNTKWMQNKIRKQQAELTRLYATMGALRQTIKNLNSQNKELEYEITEISARFDGYRLGVKEAK